jgi:hypothetical protein
LKREKRLRRHISSHFHRYLDLLNRVRVEHTPFHHLATIPIQQNTDRRMSTIRVTGAGILKHYLETFPDPNHRTNPKVLL